MGAIKVKGETSGSTTITAPATGGDESIELSTALAAKLDASEYTDWVSFTPTIIGGTTAGTGTYTTQAGIYAIIGNICTFNIRVNWTAHTGTGAFTIGTLPTCAGNVTPVSVLPDTVTSPALTTIGAALNPGQDYVTLYSVPVAGGSISSLAIDTAGGLYLAGSYRV